MAKSHLERTMDLLKKNKCLVEKVEHYNAFAGVRKDFLGFIDVIALHPAFGTLGVQVCGKDFTSHEKKILGPRREALIYWLTASPGNRCILIGWRDLKATGWTPRIREFTLDDLEEITGNVLARLAGSANPDAPDWIKPQPTNKRYFSYI